MRAPSRRSVRKGKKIEKADSKVKARTCNACATNTYQHLENHRVPYCKYQPVCKAGQRYMRATLEQVGECISCRPGTFREDESHREERCIEWSTCALKKRQYQVRRPTLKYDRVCGSYSLCTPQQWEAQSPTEDRPRICKALTDCMRGQYIAKNETKTSDRICGKCDGINAYQGSQNQFSCDQMDVCQPGQYVSRAGTRYANLLCDDCEANTFTAEKDHRDVTCRPQPFCGPTTFITKDTRSAVRVCTECPELTYQSYEQHREGKCRENDVKFCSFDQRMVNKESKSTAQSCQDCPLGEEQYDPEHTLDVCMRKTTPTTTQTSTPSSTVTTSPTSTATSTGTSTPTSTVTTTMTETATSTATTTATTTPTSTTTETTTTTSETTTTTTFTMTTTTTTLSAEALKALQRAASYKGATVGVVVASVLLLALIVIGTIWYLRRQARLDEELANKPIDDIDDPNAVSFSFVQGMASSDSMGGFNRRASSTDAGDDPTYGGLTFVAGAAATNQAFGEGSKSNAIFDGSTSESTYMDQGPWQGGESAYLDTAPGPAEVEDEGAYLDTAPGPAEVEDEGAYLDTAPGPAEEPEPDFISEMAAMEASGDNFHDEITMPSFDGGVEFDGFNELASHYESVDAIAGAGGDPTYATAMGGDALYDTAMPAAEALYDNAPGILHGEGGGEEPTYDDAADILGGEDPTYDEVVSSSSDDE